MKIKYAIGVVVSVILIILAFVIVSNKDSVYTGPKQLKIGIISILSGQFSAIGENYVKGINLAKEEFEKTHPDMKVTFAVEDDGFDTRKGISAYKKLSEVDHVDALLNLSTPTIDAIHKEVTAKNTPVIQFGIQNDGVADDSIFQVSPRAEVPILKFGEYLKQNTHFKKVAVVYEKGQPFDAFFTAFSKSYGPEKIVPMVITNKSDIQTYATRIAHEGFDGVAILALPESGALLVKKVFILTKTPPTYMIDVQLQTGWEDYKRMLGDLKILEGTYSVWIAEGKTGVFKAQYKAKYGSEPGFLADFGYDSFNTLMNAYDPDTKVWITQIRNTNTEGASGKMIFDTNGVRNQDVEIKIIKNGEALTL